MNDHPCGRIPFVLALFLALSFPPPAYSQAALDFGDAPDYDGYATTLSKNGARHAILPGFYLGLRVDAEPDGQPSPVADADDLDEAYNDEDGVRFLSRLAPGAGATVAVIASQPGFVSGWIDFEANKTWAEAGNRIFTAAVAAGTNFIPFSVPAGAALGPTYARFRFSKQGVETYNGPASDGEVEDYRVRIRFVDFGDCPDALRRPSAARLAAADGAEWDRLGDSVATDGEWLVAGGYGIGEGGVYGGTGGAYVFRWNGFDWVEFQKILASDGEVDDRMGVSVALRGEWMMIGAVGRSSGTATEAGAVYVFRWDGSQWIETQILTAEDLQRLAHFGRSVAMDGSRAVIGAHWARTDYVPAGAAYVFELDGGSWVQKARIVPSDGENDDYFGSAVALEGSHVLVGAQGDDHGAKTNAGSAYYFEESGGVWTETEKLVAPDGEAGDAFGQSVAVASGRAAIGAPHKADGGTEHAGAVYCYTLTGAGWSLIATQRHETVAAVNYGYSLAMRDNHLAVSAPFASPPGEHNRGLVRLFSWDGASWLDSARFALWDDSDVRHLGRSIDLGVQWLAAGAPATPWTESVGEAYAFDLAPYPYNYPTLYVNNGARHGLDPAVRLGEKLDTEPDAYASSDALGDDTHVDADEDGISFITTLSPGRDATIAALPSTNGFLSGWIDFNDDGDWQDAHETIALGLAVTSGVSYVTFLVAPDAAPREQGRPLYARFRFSTEPVLTVGGEASDGEVEDYTVDVEPFPDNMDFGDSPDSGAFSYCTLLANHGAWHEIKANGPWMGSAPDDDPDGLPTADAKGDDMTGSADEDGVGFSTPFVRGRSASFKVDCSTSPRAGYLNAWIDYNRNGSWDDAGEQIVVDQLIPAWLSYKWTGTVPATALVGPTYARFRICSAAGLPSYGPAVDGEVEDHALQILQAPPTADIVITNIQHSAVHGTAEVMWTAEPGVMYQLQSATNLPSSSAPSWADAGDLVLGPVNSQQDTNAAQPNGFYRVVAPWVEHP